MRIGALESLAVQRTVLGSCIVLLDPFFLHIFGHFKQVQITVDIGQILDDLRRIHFYVYMPLSFLFSLFRSHHTAKVCLAMYSKST